MPGKLVGLLIYSRKNHLPFADYCALYIVLLTVDVKRFGLLRDIKPSQNERPSKFSL